MTKMTEKSWTGKGESGRAEGNSLTELVFILDNSGSMAGLETDTIGGFNSMIEKQRKTEGDCFVSTILFNDTSRVLHDRLPLSEIPKMTDADYAVCGCTALLDAIGGAIHHVGNIHKYARPEDVPAHTVFVITTDGMENASRRYDIRRVQQMIERQKERYGWEFLFVGANIDAVETAGAFGIGADRAVNYHADSQGTTILYDTVSAAVADVRARGTLRASWSEGLREDYDSRQSGKQKSPAPKRRFLKRRG